ncbi:MAG TPA: CARDB domain-containing protein, partial [Acidimicrobiales bacterium]|nr:CARDB domain-containing protein [Acidimicrobiales bacterium]
MSARRFARMTAIALAGLTSLASPAGALISGSEPVPVDPPDRPDLRVSALTATPVGADWSIGYTVANAGSAPSPSSTVAFGGNGVATTRSVPSLAAGAVRTGTFLVPRADCFVVVTATADSTRVVTESNEANNAREVIGVVPGCPPRYRITASNFKALDESGIDLSGSD